jgi:methylthioribose-1-phosphate isomerase
MNFESLSLRVDTSIKKIFILDQTLLPAQEVWIEIEDPDHAVKLIKNLSVRGAPLIGVVAALVAAKAISDLGQVGSLANWRVSARNILIQLREARPTAVNLMNAIDRLALKLALDLFPTETEKGFVENTMTLEQQLALAESIWKEALLILSEDVELCEKIATHGANELKKINPRNILTICNTGGLATAGIGTALGVIGRWYKEVIQPKSTLKDQNAACVWPLETRPLLQGARLTTWELQKLEIPFRLITDGMAAHVLESKSIDAVLVGADRIAANGDFANKIGTQSLSILCQHFKIPFFVCAPLTTFDFKMKNGSEIPIEERTPSEVRFPLAPDNCSVYNPAFDVSLGIHCTGFITDRGVFKHDELLGLANS